METYEEVEFINLLSTSYMFYQGKKLSDRTTGITLNKLSVTSLYLHARVTQCANIIIMYIYSDFSLL